METAYLAGLRSQNRIAFLEPSKYTELGKKLENVNHFFLLEDTVNYDSGRRGQLSTTAEARPVKNRYLVFALATSHLPWTGARAHDGCQSGHVRYTSTSEKHFIFPSRLFLVPVFFLLFYVLGNRKLLRMNEFFSFFQSEKMNIYCRKFTTLCRYGTSLFSLLNFRPFQTSSICI
jgi:hypothetical protein